MTQRASQRLKAGRAMLSMAMKGGMMIRPPALPRSIRCAEWWSIPLPWPMKRSMKGERYVFCSAGCKAKFMADPQRYPASAGRDG